MVATSHHEPHHDHGCGGAGPGHSHRIPVAKPRSIPWQMFLWIWASPTTLLGLLLGMVGLCSGGQCQRVGNTLEFHGGLLSNMLNSFIVKAAGMTLGHVILGQTESVLETIRYHEGVHVRQYEKWGPFFLPAYICGSVYMWLNGKDFYRDNPFEAEAYLADARRLSQPPAADEA